ncbi:MULTISPECIES: UDP-glucose 4-epimerase GalE [unclassified Synechococcus]|jgi:UDP-glucose 4-epimerase|uniref:UDP-glucose 4-epimerase GalE n=1 Tax=unclassified Synechococcus TaxID=2626047 RepID=UPI0018CF5AAC|nr:MULTISPECIES: UDP-glucose 4-epimerase GalE [unclassified Synechococcus]MEA5424160.1 UDP-glucose 4-epimerase GalE [Synechococcus sp. CCY9202]QPN60710.1 UDP-glucose 4-epimerase GalE [Synechococcus sp. CBW1002]CAK6687392.1 UDP-glucose 4-epimerase [Synechococcus sp. CBW1107]
MALLLITGGAGFIGSHCCVALLEAGHALVVLDNFDNSSPEALRRVAELGGLEGEAGGPWRDGDGAVRLRLVEGDVRCADDLDTAFTPTPDGATPGDITPPGIAAVVHCAGLKAVGESVAEPLRYWDTNLGGSLRLLEAMRRHGCRTIVFSSSATLYGYPEAVPIPETAPIQPINPYGHSKAAVEQVLADVAASESGWRIARLRYFNPVGSHPSGRIGEDPEGIPNNLFPYLSQVAVGRRQTLQIFGSDWPTPDGTGVRDYIHVMDLADGHRAALDTLLREEPQLLTVNLGSGQGHSVLDVVRAFEAACGHRLPYELVDRRPGDAATTVADPSLASKRLDWRTRRSLADICRDGWAWQSANPRGYGP